MATSREEFARRLRKLRTLTGLTQTQFSEFMGLEPYQYGAWERASHMPSEKNLRRILRCLSILSGRRVRREELMGDA